MVLECILQNVLKFLFYVIQWYTERMHRMITSFQSLFGFIGPKFICCNRWSFELRHLTWAIFQTFMFQASSFSNRNTPKWHSANAYEFKNEVELSGFRSFSFLITVFFHRYSAPVCPFDRKPRRCLSDNWTKYFWFTSFVILRDENIFCHGQLFIILQKTYRQSNVYLRASDRFRRNCLFQRFLCNI